MKKNFSNSLEGDRIASQSRSPSYKFLNHEKYESKSIPLDLNLLKFQERSNNQKLIRILYEDAESLGPSEEFKANMIYYFLYTLIYLLSLLGFAILLQSSGHLSSTHLKIHIICINSLFVFAVLILIGMCRSTKIRRKSRNYFLILSCLMNFYLIFADERILHRLTGEVYKDTRLPLSLGLICGITITRLVLFDYYLYTFIIGISNTVIFLTTHLAISEYTLYATLAEASIIGLFSVMQIVECYRSDFRIKQIFWRREQEAMQDSTIHKKNKSYKIPGINTETETVLSKCDIITSNLKNISKIVIYKDVKKMLKKSIIDLEKIKRKVGHSSFDATKIELSPAIDEEDRAFIVENFMEMGSVRSSVVVPFNSDLSEKFAINPFTKYGVNELESVLSGIGKNWNFNIFFIFDTTNQSISMVSKYLFQKWSLSEFLKINEKVADSYFEELEKEYYKNPYHNACHASDVLHSFLFFILNSEVIKYLSPLEILAVIVASLGHDVGHPGLTNRYLVNTRDPLATQYNDLSVLENMHCFLIFKLLNNSNCNIFQCLENSDWVSIRKLIIEMVLETDMSKHFEILSKFRTRAIMLSDLNVIEDKSTILSMGLKCADIGHTAKDTDLHIKWTGLVIEEFFAQGDMEKKQNLPVSMYCDRGTTDVAKSQIGFIKNICLPLFEVWCKYLDSQVLEKMVLEQIKNNLAYWEKKKKKRIGTEISKIEALTAIKLKRRQSEN